VADGQDANRAADIINAVVNDERRDRHGPDGLRGILAMLMTLVAVWEKVKRVNYRQQPLGNK